MKNIYSHLSNRIEKNKQLALGTIIETEGSTPQIQGASALFSSGGMLSGTLGGGLLEAEAMKRALQALQKKTSLILQFSLETDIAMDEGAICGGAVKILIDASPEEHKDSFQNLARSLLKREPGVLATFINKLSGEDVSILRYWIKEEKGLDVKAEKHLSLFQEEIHRVIAEKNPRLGPTKEKIFPRQTEECLLFLEPVFPQPHLVIAGAGHIGQAVAHLGSLLNFEIAVIDDRPEFANKERLPDADHIIVGDLGEEIRKLPISQDTYLIIVTRGHFHDAEVLKECIASEAAYIGMIGSRRKIELMRKNFLGKGWATPGQFDSVYAPIGIDIQSKTVEEIAVSIAAQLVLVRSQIQEKRKD